MLACARTGAIAVLVDGAAAARHRRAVRRDHHTVGHRPRAPGAALTEDARPGGLPVIDIGIDSPTDDSGLIADPGVVSAPDDPLAMIFTSGTTGEPKAVLLAHRTFYAVADILAAEGLDWIDWAPGQSTYSPLLATLHRRAVVDPQLPHARQPLHHRR